MALWRSTKYSRMATVPIPGTTSGPGKRAWDVDPGAASSLESLRDADLPGRIAGIYGQIVRLCVVRRNWYPLADLSLVILTPGRKTSLIR